MVYCSQFLIIQVNFFSCRTPWQKYPRSLNNRSHYYGVSKSRLDLLKEQHIILPIFLSPQYGWLQRNFLCSRPVVLSPLQCITQNQAFPLQRATNPAKQREPIISLLKPVHVKGIGVCKQIKITLWCSKTSAKRSHSL